MLPTWSAFDLPAKELELARLDRESARPDLWDDPLAAQDMLRKSSALRQTLETWRALEHQINSVIDLVDLATTEQAPELEEEIRSEFADAARKLEALEVHAMLGGRYDGNSAIVSVQAGAGGVDSQDWAQMLALMYQRWAEAKRYKVTILDWVDGDEAVIKRPDLEVEGEDAYGYLKAEAGVHRLIRLSPYDNQHQRHTSFALIEVLPEVEDAADVVINPDDLRIDYFRSSGAGGQNVQKNSTAVRIVHEPSGITVAVQNERSQSRNREIALKILMAKLMERELVRRREEEAKLRGEHISPEWGNQIRTYVLHPYKMVKDHRTNYEVSDPEAVLNGDLDGFLLAYLRTRVGTAGTTG